MKTMQDLKNEDRDMSFLELEDCSEWVSPPYDYDLNMLRTTYYGIECNEVDITVTVDYWVEVDFGSVSMTVECAHISALTAIKAAFRSIAALNDFITEIEESEATNANI